MPLLAITTTRERPPDETEPVLDAVSSSYVDVMESESRFLALRLSTVQPEHLRLGRAEPDADVVLLEADVRAGRPLEQRREFALAFVETVHEAWGVPEANVKVVFTQHEGTDMMGADRVGGDWRASESESNAG